MCKSNLVIFKGSDQEQERDEKEGVFSETDFKKRSFEIRVNSVNLNEDLPCISHRSPTKVRGRFF